MSRSDERQAAIRHLVYREMLLLLPPASYAQAEQFIANLALARNHGFSAAERQTEQAAKISRTMQRFLNLRVSPEIATLGGRHLRRPQLEATLAERFGDQLKDVAGFYFDRTWRLNLPEACALYGYSNRYGFYTGVLCQPLAQINKYFLLSSASYDGPKAIRLEPADRFYFEQWKTPAEHGQNAARLNNEVADFINARIEEQPFMDQLRELGDIERALATAKQALFAEFNEEKERPRKLRAVK